jgi:hypothetical protein
MLCIVAVLITFLISVIGSFLLGRYYSVDKRDESILADAQRLKQTLNEKTTLVTQLEQQVANMRLASEVDRKANEEVREEAVKLRTQLAELEEDNTFYRSLMRPAPGDKGLVVDPPSVTPTDVSGVYKYNMVIKQIVAQHQQVNGYAEFTLLGKQGEQAVQFALKDISDDVTVERIKLNFKYFQRIEGEMRLPEGFFPERIELKIVTQRPDSVVIEK